MAQSTVCNEEQSVLWSQLPAQDWPATQSLLEEIESITLEGASVELSKEIPSTEPALTPEVPLSVDAKALALLEVVETFDTVRATPEPPAICFTKLDPSCVRDPGSSSTPSLPHVERCGWNDESLEVHAQLSETVAFAHKAEEVGPNGVRSNLERPPRR